MDEGDPGDDDDMDYDGMALLSEDEYGGDDDYDNRDNDNDDDVSYDNASKVDS